MTYDLLGHTRAHTESRAEAIAARDRDTSPDFDDIYHTHPAIPTSEQLNTMLRAFIVAGLITLAVMFLGGCSTYEHRDGGGFTVRYASATPYVEPADEKKRPRKVVYSKPKSAPAAEPAVVVIEPRERGDSHPVLNVGQDDEIPREYRHYVSDRSIRTLRARTAMCREQRPGYCNAPNVPHCHGPFCHAHQGGDRRHTH